MRFFGWQNKVEGVVFNALSKFFCRLRFGFAKKPKSVRQRCSVRCMRACKYFVLVDSRTLAFEYLFFRL